MRLIEISPRDKKIETKKNPDIAIRVLKFGRRERIRTSDPLVPNQLRYQAALLAESGRILLLRTWAVNHFLTTRG